MLPVHLCSCLVFSGSWPLFQRPSLLPSSEADVMSGAAVYCTNQRGAIFGIWHSVIIRGLEL